MLGRLRSFARALVGRRRFERGMADELRFHVDAYASDLEREGLSAQEAARRARAAFGGVDGVREDCRRSRGLQLIDQLRQDLAYALRLMKRAPAVTTAAIVSLGLGIGANTAIFSLIDAVLLRPLAVAHPEKLFFLAHGEGERPSTSSNYPLLERYRTVVAFSGVTAFRPGTFTVDALGSSELISGQFVSGNYHTVVGAPLLLGRGFVSDPDRPSDNGGVAVISEGYWERRFGRAPDILGQVLTVQGHRVEIVGVAASTFGGFTPGTVVDVTLPLALYVRDNPKYLDASDGFTSMPIVARLAPGASEAQAAAAADARFQQFMAQPEVSWARKYSADGFTTARLVPAGRGEDGLRHQYATPLLALMTMAGLVLLIASANIASLLLARSDARAREVAIRVCVGSGRGRVVRQFLTESAVLALAGGALGAWLAFWGTDFVVTLFSTWRQPLVLDVSPNLRVLAFTTAVALATGLAFGIVPALKATRVDLTPMLKSGASALHGVTGRSVVNHGLIILQVALCVVVVVISALLAQSVRNLKARHAGFDATNVLLFDAFRSPASTLTSAALPAIHAGIVERLESRRDVVAASVSTMTPMNRAGTFRGLVIEGAPETPDVRGVFWNQVSDDYFRTFGVRVLRGRTFENQDRSRRVAVINDGTARHVYGDVDPIGRTIAWMSAPDGPIEVIGVVEDTSLDSLRVAAPRMVYTSLASASSLPIVQVAIRTVGDPRALAGSVREIVRGVSPDVVVTRVRAMDEQVDSALVGERALAWLSAAFAVLASVLACVGLYGVMSYHVARRTREIGIRLALGARPQAVLAGVLRRTMLLALAGIAAGTAGALVATEMVATFLYGLSANDPFTLTAVGMALAVTMLAAGYGPARRAARIEPLRAIRTE